MQALGYIVTLCYVRFNEAAGADPADAGEELTNSRHLSTRPASPPVFSCRS